MHHLFVGVKKDRQQLNVRQADGAYPGVPTQTESLIDILDQHVHSRLIHFATMDIEGYEYVLMKAMLRGGPFHDAGLVFCQLDVELHVPKHT